jgi:hypothetical protein
MMEHRIAKLSFGGAVILAVGYFYLPLTLEKWMRQTEWRPPSGGLGDFAQYDRKGGLAPVELQWVGDLGEADLVSIRAAYSSSHHDWFAVNLKAIRGQVFAGGELVPLERVSDYINARLKPEVDVVILTPVKGAAWGEMFPILDACRRSRARVIYVNSYENL